MAPAIMPLVPGGASDRNDDRYVPISSGRRFGHRSPILVAPGDLVGLAQAIEYFADPERRTAAGQAAREGIMDAFALEQAIHRHHDLLLELLGEAESSTEKHPPHQHS